MNVENCEQIKDENITLAQKILRFDLRTGKTTHSKGVPMQPYSGASLPMVLLPTGELLMHTVFMVRGTESTMLLRWSPGDARSSAPSLSGQCRLSERMAAIFVVDGTVYAVPFARARELRKIVQARSELLGGLPCRESVVAAQLPVAIYANKTQPVPGGGNVTLPDAARYAVVGKALFFADEASSLLIGVKLPQSTVVYNASLMEELDYTSLSPGGESTLLVGNDAKALKLVDITDPSAPPARLSFPNATNMFTSSASGVVVYSVRFSQTEIGWVAADVEGHTLLASPALTNLCNKPAYSCMMEFVIFDDRPDR
jgi:hypothetical protein